MSVTDFYWARESQTPAPAPDSIRLSDGRLRTDKTTFTEAEMQDAGYTVKADPPPSPKSWQTLAWDGSQWTTPDRDLATVRAERKAQLTQTRNQGIFAGAVSYDLAADTDVVDSAGNVLSTAPAGTTIEPDLRGPQDQQNLSQLASAATDALAAGVQQTFDFKDSTDVIYRLSRDDMRGAAAAARAHGQVWWRAWWRHKDAVDATTTAQDAYEYDPADNGGWPS